MRLIKIIRFSLVFYFALAIGFNMALENCAALIQAAIETASENCNALRQNQACYGNVQVEAEPNETVSSDEFIFEAAGDRVDINALASMRLSSLQDSVENWGIVSLQTNAIIGDSTESISIVMFGNVELDRIESIPLEEPVQLAFTSNSTINVRSGASTNDEVLGSISSGQSYTAIGRSEAGDWLQFELNEAQLGWVYAPLVTFDGDIMSLDISTNQVASDDRIEFGPLQAFQFSTIEETLLCDEAPRSGMLIQTPDGEGRIQVQVNEVSIELDSTAYLETTNNVLSIYLLEGNAFVSSGEERRLVLASTFSTIPLDENGLANAIPSIPVAYDVNELGILPLDLLPRAISVATEIGDAPIILGLRPVLNSITRDGFCDWFLGVDFIDVNGDAGSMNLRLEYESGEPRILENSSVVRLPNEWGDTPESRRFSIEE